MNPQPARPSVPPASAEDRERLLAELADALVDGLKRGEPPDVEALASAYPDVADDLRSLWATMLLADCVAAGARSSSGDALTGKRRGGRSGDEPTVATPGSDPDVVQANSFAGARPGVAFGDYELLEELGRGGMGVVYQGATAEPGTHRGLEDDPARRKRFAGRSGAVSCRGGSGRETRSPVDRADLRSRRA